MKQAERLFLEYGKSLDFSLDFQNFNNELQNLPGKYAPPQGCILLAFTENQSIGCVGLRPMEENICEMKRLYVMPEFRSTGLGRQLTDEIIVKGMNLGYSKMRLDTLSSMKAAVNLYKSFGFAETDAYYHNPHPEVLYFEKILYQDKNDS